MDGRLCIGWGGCTGMCVTHLSIISNHCLTTQGYLYQNLQGGDWRYWTFLDKLWTFQYAAEFRDPCILIKRCTNYCGPFCTPRGSEVQISHKTSKKGLQNIQKSIVALSYLPGAATRRLITPCIQCVLFFSFFSQCAFT